MLRIKWANALAFFGMLFSVLVSAGTTLLVIARTPPRKVANSGALAVAAGIAAGFSGALIHSGVEKKRRQAAFDNLGQELSDYAELKLDCPEGCEHDDCLMKKPEGHLQLAAEAFQQAIGSALQIGVHPAMATVALVLQVAAMIETNRRQGHLEEAIRYSPRWIPFGEVATILGASWPEIAKHIPMSVAITQAASKECEEESN